MIMQDYKHVGHRKWSLDNRVPLVLTVINTLLTTIAVVGVAAVWFH